MTPASYPVQMRWRDLDGLGHVSHNVALTYLEEGRDAFLGTCGIGRRDYVVGRCSVNFLGEIVPELRTVIAQCSITRVGDSSVTTNEHLLSEGGDVLVEAEFGLVLWDADRHASRAATDAERAALMRPEEVSA